MLAGGKQMENMQDMPNHNAQSLTFVLATIFFLCYHYVVVDSLLRVSSL